MKGTGSLSSDNEIWIFPFHATLVELDGSPVDYPHTRQSTTDEDIYT